MTRPRVVIAGAGFGGLTCARALKHAPVHVLIVDRNNYHLFTPLLYQVASALLDPGEIARPVRALIRPLANVDFKQAEVTGADLDGRKLLTDRGAIPYDYLVLATGSRSDYFGNESLARHAMGLKDLDEGLALRNRILSQFEASRWVSDTAQRKVLLTFAVVGAGPTGVELAGSLSELIRLVLRKDYRDLELSEVRVLLLEGAAAPLGTFAPALREAARKSLEKKGVEVLLGARVESLDEGSIKLVGGAEIAAGTVVWTAGVRASDVGKALGVELVRQARVKVDATLQVPGHPAVFVIGDMAGATVGGALLPMLIPVAMQEGRQVGATIAALVRNGGAHPFHYKDPGIMATIGRNSAVAELGAVRLSGFLGWLMWLGVHLVNVISFRSRIVVLVNWAWDYLFYDRPIRLIVRAKQGGAPGTGSARPGAQGGTSPLKTTHRHKKTRRGANTAEVTRLKATLVAAGAGAAVALNACGGLQSEDPGQVLRDAGAAMAKLTTVNAALKFTKGTVSFQGYVLTSATAAVRLPTDSDTIYKVKYQDVLVGLEVVITGGHVFLRPPFSGFTEVTGKTAAEVPDLAKLFNATTGLPAMIPAGQNPTSMGTEKVVDVDSYKIGASYSAAQIAKLLPQLSSTGDVTATIWVGGADHLIRKALLSGPFGDGGTQSTVEIDLSAFNAAVAIASPTP